MKHDEGHIVLVASRLTKNRTKAHKHPKENFRIFFKKAGELFLNN